MVKNHIANLHPVIHWPNNKEETMKNKIDHNIDFDIIGNKIFINCQECEHSFELHHLEWSAIICPVCRYVIRQEDEEEESEEEIEMFDKDKAKIPVVILKKGTEQLEVLTPTDALLFLKSNECVDDIHWVLEGTFECSMQKLIDILICHPSFFPCLDVAIDSDPRDRKIKRVLMKAKSQPEN